MLRKSSLGMISSKGGLLNIVNQPIACGTYYCVDIYVSRNTNQTACNRPHTQQKRLSSREKRCMYASAINSILCPLRREVGRSQLGRRHIFACRIHTYSSTADRVRKKKKKSQQKSGCMCGGPAVWVSSVLSGACGSVHQHVNTAVFSIQHQPRPSKTPHLARYSVHTRQAYISLHTTTGKYFFKERTIGSLHTAVAYVLFSKLGLL